MRNHNSEFQDNDRQYAYDFDYVLRTYMIRQLKPFFLPGRALELGCYQGEMTAMLMDEFPELTVVEGASELIAMAAVRTRNRPQFICSTFEEAILDPVYSNVFLVHTLEHLDDPIETLRRISAWLAPKGRLFVAVPNANAPSRQIAVAMGLITHNTAVAKSEREHGHRITYTLDTLERDIRTAGLTAIHRGGVFFKPFANYQFDRLREADIVSSAYLEGCYTLGMRYPDLCASVFAVCEATTT